MPYSNKLKRHKYLGSFFNSQRHAINYLASLCICKNDKSCLSNSNSLTFLVILDSGGRTRNPNRTSCPRRVTAVTLGLFPRLMHIRSLSKTSGSGPMTWDNFPEITATHKPLRHHLRTWLSNKSPKTKDLKQVVNLTPVFCWFSFFSSLCFW